MSFLLLGPISITHSISSPWKPNDVGNEQNVFYKFIDVRKKPPSQIVQHDFELDEKRTFQNIHRSDPKSRQNQVAGLLLLEPT